MIDTFCLTVEQVAALTPRQKHELYFHKRNKQGSLVPPDRMGSPFKSEAQELAALESFNKALGGTMSNFEKIKEGVRKRWAALAPPESAKPQKTFGGGT